MLSQVVCNFCEIFVNCIGGSNLALIINVLDVGYFGSSNSLLSSVNISDKERSLIRQDPWAVLLEHSEWTEWHTEDG